MGRGKRLSSDQAKELAVPHLRAKIEALELSSEERKPIHLGIGFEGDERIVQAFIPGKEPRDGRILASVSVNVVTGEVRDAPIPIELAWRADGS